MYSYQLNGKLIHHMLCMILLHFVHNVIVSFFFITCACIVIGNCFIYPVNRILSGSEWRACRVFNACMSPKPL